MNPSKTKTCPDCGEKKASDAFYVDRKRAGALHTYCKDCCKRRAKEAYERSDKAARNRQHREWVRANKDRLRIYKTAAALGIPSEQVQAMVDRGRCDICGATSALCVDHCHLKGAVRGLLCQACNKGLGFFKDDPSRLRSAIRYLRQE